jgi:hypothetical protein
MTTLLTRLRARPIAALIALIALALAALLFLAYWTGLIHSALGLSPSSSASEEVVNTEGGYSITVPDGWSSTQDGRTTTVTSADGETLITFGLGRTGPLPVAATLFYQEVAGNYDKVEVFAPDAMRVDSRNALAYGGVGDNDKGVRIRFVAISVENQPTNYGIVVFTAANSDPATTLPVTNQIVESFRTLPPS